MMYVYTFQRALMHFTVFCWNKGNCRRNWILFR